MNGNGYQPELKEALRALRLPVFAAEHSATGAIAANEGWTFDRFLLELCQLELIQREPSCDLREGPGELAAHLPDVLKLAVVIPQEARIHPPIPAGSPRRPGPPAAS